jgi:hypothetical protein
VASNEWPVREEADFLRAQCHRSGVEPGDLQDLAAYYWVRHVGSQLKTHARYDVPRLWHRLEGFVAYAIESLNATSASIAVSRP